MCWLMTALCCPGHRLILENLLKYGWRLNFISYVSRSLAGRGNLPLVLTFPALVALSLLALAVETLGRYALKAEGQVRWNPDDMLAAHWNARHTVNLVCINSTKGDGASCSTLTRQTLLRLPYSAAAKALATDWLFMHRQVPDDCAIYHSPVGGWL
jgi:hypothetical protein